MAQDIGTLLTALKQLKNELPEVLGSTAESMAGTAKALAQLTIEKEAILGRYSAGVVPAFWLEGKELNARGTSFLAKVMKAKEPKDRVTNWGELRKAQGLQTDHVDLTYSGEMWRGLMPQPYRVDGTMYVSDLAHNNKAGQDKLNWNRQRYGNFVMKALNTGDNQEAIKAVLNEEMKRFFSKYLKIK